MPLPLKVKKTLVQFGYTDGMQDLPHFMAERFRGWSPSHQASIICGSSSLYFTPKGLGEHYVCDAGACGIVDNYAILERRPLQFNFAVTDGLGYEDDDQQFNLSLGAVAGTASQLFVEQAGHYSASNSFINNPNLFLKNLADLSKQAALRNTATQQPYDSECSIAAGQVNYENKKWQARFTNIGDGMIVVVNGVTQQVKAVVPAVHVRRFMGSYSPSSLQEFIKTDVELGLTDMQVEEGDYLISMTDGAYSSFDLDIENGPIPDNDKTHLPVFRKIRINSASFEACLSGLSPDKYHSAYEIAHLILAQAMDKHLQEYHQALKLHQKISTYIASDFQLYKKMTLDKFLVELSKKDPDLFTLADAYLNNDGSHDGAVFNMEKAWVGDLLHLLSTQEYGDCTTISVMRVPFYADELVKLLIDKPAQVEALAGEIQAHITDAELPKIIERLRQEQVCPGVVNQPGFKIGQEDLYYHFNEEQLKRVEKLLTNAVNEKSISFFKHAFHSLSIMCSSSSADDVIKAKGKRVSPYLKDKSITHLKNQLQSATSTIASSSSQDNSQTNKKKFY